EDPPSNQKKSHTYINPPGKPPLHTLRRHIYSRCVFRIRDSRNPMLYVKNRTAGRLTPKERRQLLFWGSVLILAMLCLMYLIIPSANTPQKPAPAQQQTGKSNSAKPAPPGL